MFGALLLEVACFPDIKPITFDPIDVPALESALAEPTGEVNEETLIEIADHLIENERAFQAVRALIQEVYEEDGGDTTPDGKVFRELSGTNAYVRISCTGHDIQNPVTDFSEGELRIDSPTFTDEFLENYDTKGDMLVRFSACRYTTMVFEGELVMHYDAEMSRAALDPDISWVDDADSSLDGALISPMLQELGVGVQVLFTLEAGETLVLEWLDAQADTVGIRGVNGSAVCIFSQDVETWNCEVP
jgi:hypothetical protein